MELGYGIQVSLGMDYLVYNFVSVRGEMRFRDPSFENRSKYNKDLVTYEGRTYQLTNKEVDSEININGITFRIGAVFHF